MVGRVDPKVYDCGMEHMHNQTDIQDYNSLSLPELAGLLRQSGRTRRLLNLAREEDLGDPLHDWTGELMFQSDDQRAVVMRSRDSGIVSGIEFLADLVETFSPDGDIQWDAKVADGEEIEHGVVLARLSGNARALVQLERTMLNLISRMSGIATHTKEYVSLVEGTNARICDTRKTTPGIRAFEKYAVRCGGGTTHRMGLYDAVLIKDNHLAGVEAVNIATQIQNGVYKIRREGAKLSFVQVEVDTLDQLSEVFAIEAGVVNIVLLDNMNTDQLSEAVRVRDKCDQGVLLEASGGISRETVRGIAKTGVDRISIGGLTHQAQSLDIGLDTV
jgi:nicotinate-nucleotide pyrophosphorylase (carboxylating)